MRFYKIIVVSILLLLLAKASFADFSTPEEFITTIQQFSEEEFGITLVFDTTSQIDMDRVGYDTIYSLCVCPKTRFWKGSNYLCSLDVYSGTVYPDALIQIYQSSNYDISLRKLAPSDLADASRIQKLPDLFQITTRKIMIIFHEGFHYHLIQQNRGYQNRNTINGRAIEEGAATIFGVMAADLFVEKYYGAKSVKSWAAKQRIRDYDHRYDNVSILYFWLSEIYQEDSPDSIKVAKAQKIFNNSDSNGNAGLTSHYLYGQYYFAFKNVWRKYDDKKEAVKRFTRIVRQESF